MGVPFQMSIVPFRLEFIITEKTTFILFEVMTMTSSVRPSNTVKQCRKVESVERLSSVGRVDNALRTESRDHRKPASM
jgi:hypothetical protein